MLDCPVCGKSVADTHLKNHVCKLHSVEDWNQYKEQKVSNLCIKVSETQLQCKLCDFVGSSPRSIQSHNMVKHSNRPELLSRFASNRKGKPSWNKGLTQTTDKRVRQRVLTLQENIKSGKTTIVGRPLSDEHKKKISLKRREFLEKHPDKVPYVVNHTSKISYPEQYFLECFKDVTNITFQHRVFRYKLDFANIEEKIYLEIDGEQHYSDQRIVEHDISRTKKLNELGWTCYRIRWSEFKKLSEESKKAKVIETKSLLKCIEEI
jgi:hypothetical protein